MRFVPAVGERMNAEAEVRRESAACFRESATSPNVGTSSTTRPESVEAVLVPCQRLPIAMARIWPLWVSSVSRPYEDAWISPDVVFASTVSPRRFAEILASVVESASARSFGT